MTHSKATFGIFRNKEEINSAVTLLKGLGFGDARASVLFPDNPGAQDFPQVQKSELVKFARIGSAIGAALFAVFGILVLREVVPFGGMAQLSAVGQIFAMIASVIIGGVVGAACGTLVGIGTPDRAGRRYGQYVNAGGILLSVHSENPDQQKRLEEILEKSGAQDITSVDEKEGWQDVMNEKHSLERTDLTHVSGQSARPLYSIEELAEEKKTYV